MVERLDSGLILSNTSFSQIVGAQIRQTKGGFMGYNDGMNTQGLTVSGLFFQGVNYPSTVNDPGKALLITDFALWALSQFESVDQITSAIRNGNVELWAPADAIPAHFAVTDKYGNSLSSSLLAIQPILKSGFILMILLIPPK